MMPGGEEQVRSECSSGCQSGWTMYLDQSSSSYEAPSSHLYKKGGSFRQEDDREEDEEEEEEEEEDLSMVSDASSGPPHFHGRADQHYDSRQVSHPCRQGSGSLCSAMAPAAALPVKGGKKKRRVESGLREESSSLLDDTASSPLFNCSETSFSGDRKKGNFCMKSSMEGDDALEFSCGFSATHLKGKSALRKETSYTTSSVHVKPNPTRSVSRTECGRKMR